MSRGWSGDEQHRAAGLMQMLCRCGGDDSEDAEGAFQWNVKFHPRVTLQPSSCLRLRREQTGDEDEDEDYGGEPN